MAVGLNPDCRLAAIEDPDLEAFWLAKKRLKYD